MRFGHSGKLGDMIYALPQIEAMGGGELVVFWRDECHISRTEFDAIEPLLSRQPYLTSVSWQDNWSGPGLNLDTWRRHINWNLNISDMMASWLGLPQVERGRPWLQPPEDSQQLASVVISRTNRHHNPRFPWRDVLGEFGSQAAFLGLPEEHAEFQETYGRIEFIPTSDFYEAARVIWAADLFIGAQGGLLAVAEGLKVPVLMECFPPAPTTRFERSLAWHVFTEHDARPTKGWLPAIRKTRDSLLHMGKAHA